MYSGKGVHTNRHTCVCVHKHTSVFIHTHTHKYLYTHIHAPTHKHSDRHTLKLSLGVACFTEGGRYLWQEYKMNSCAFSPNDNPETIPCWWGTASASRHCLNVCMCVPVRVRVCVHVFVSVYVFVFVRGNLCVQCFYCYT